MCHTYEPPREIDDWNSAAVVDGAEAGARADLEVVGSAKGRETESRESSSRWEGNFGQWLIGRDACGATWSCGVTSGLIVT